MGAHLGDIVGDPAMMPTTLLHPTIDKPPTKKSWTNHTTEVAVEARKWTTDHRTNKCKKKRRATYIKPSPPWQHHRRKNGIDASATGDELTTKESTTLLWE